MATLERDENGHRQRRKTPSFSSSLLDAIYHSIDESKKGDEEEGEEKNQGSFFLYRRNNAVQGEEEIASLRRAIMIEKWMESYNNNSSSKARGPAAERRNGSSNSNSSSSTDSSSSMFSSSSDPESISRPSIFKMQKQKQSQTPLSERIAQFDQATATPKHHHEGKFMTRTKSRALKIYGDLKKVKQPISPGGRIANFLNSIFTPRNLKKHDQNRHHQGMEDWGVDRVVRKSRSLKDYSSTTTTCSLASGRSCLSKAPSSRGNKSKRSVKFCPVSVIVDEDCQPCGHKSIYDNYEPSLVAPSSHFIKKNIDSFRALEEEVYSDDDGKSCTSSDLFELENINAVVGIGGVYREELPVYGTTNLKLNQAIASGLFV